MTNEERRTALNRARALTLTHAELASATDAEADGLAFTRHVKLAEAWAGVAEAMKDGDPIHDGPDGRPVKASAFAHPITPEGVTVR